MLGLLIVYSWKHRDDTSGSLLVLKVDCLFCFPKQIPPALQVSDKAHPQHCLLEFLQQLKTGFVGCCVICWSKQGCSEEPLPLPSKAGITGRPYIPPTWHLGGF